jgi:hypothetical protein
VARKLQTQLSFGGQRLIDLHFTAAYVAAALATAALVCDEALGLAAATDTAPMRQAGEHPGQPDQPEWVRRPVDRADRHEERPMASSRVGH